MKSSVMWQAVPGQDNFIYPPGIPAVLRSMSQNRQFRVEQYFTKFVTGSMLHPSVSGTWPRTDANELDFDSGVREWAGRRINGIWRNRFVKISQPQCELDANVELYRCITDFEFSQRVPAGTIGVSIDFSFRQAAVSHPNSIFWIVVPEESAAPSVSFEDHAQSPPGSVCRPSEYRDLEEVKKYVVRISLDNNFTLGSGFIVRDVRAFARLFHPRIMEVADRVPSDGVFIVTAAHLFPLAYAQGGAEDPFTNPAYHELGIFNAGYVYDLHDQNKTRLRRSAILFARNMESDIALMYIPRTKTEQLLGALEVENLGAVAGLQLGDCIETDTSFIAMGYPAKTESNSIVLNTGYLPNGAGQTDDTSNFGPLGKFKLEGRVAGEIVAQPGMSGGPIVDRHGLVVGIAAERPNNANSLIAINITNIEHLEHGYALDYEQCLLRFNPFDRILTIVRKNAACRYGRFGSLREFEPLWGEFVLQEVLGFASENPQPGGRRGYAFTNGHSIINGHAIINGHSIIKGRSIINGRVVVNRDNLDDVNKHKVLQGFRLNSDSFRTFEPRGVRVLKAEVDGIEAPLGELIWGTKNDQSATKFDPVYSIREFSIWLHQNADRSNLKALICTSGRNCLE